VIRIAFRALLWLHPPAFRRQFADEMLWIFDETRGKQAAALLFSDGPISLARQWLLRSGAWKLAVAGAGGLMFDPKNLAGASTQARAAFVYGAGADINMSKRLFMRAEYRGLVYNSPTFGIPGLAGTDRITHKAEPTVGFGFRF